MVEPTPDQQLPIKSTGNRLSQWLWLGLVGVLMLGLWVMVVHPLIQRQAAWNWLEAHGHRIGPRIVWWCPKRLATYANNSLLRPVFFRIYYLELNFKIKQTRLTSEEWEELRERVQHFPELHSLDLVSQTCGDFTLPGDFFVVCPQLEWLGVIGIKVSDADWEAIARLRQLKYLQLNQVTGGKKSFSQLARLPKLESLNLGITDVTGKQLRSLKTFPALKQLDLGNMSVAENELIDMEAVTRELLLAKPDLQIVDD